jgi:hypothetical protein
VGRSLDFVPRNPPPPALRRFWILHGVYTFLEGCKLVVGGVIVAVWIGRGIPTSASRPSRCVILAHERGGESAPGLGSEA